MDEKALGKRLQLARRRAGLTQQELCHKANLSYSTLAKIERGAIQTPSVFTVAAIATATGIPLEELVGLKKSAQTPADSKKISKTGIRFVYFDINGVLVRFFHQAFTKVAHDSGKSADIIETLFWRHNDAVCRGNLKQSQFNALFGKEIEIKDFDWQKYYMDSVETMPHIGELVKWASTHYEVGLLSNSMPGFIDKLRELGRIPDGNYTTIVDSSKVGSIKPEPRIYEIAEQLAAVKPGEILLVDDSRANLTAADRAGWHVLWFDDFRPVESIERVKASLQF